MELPHERLTGKVTWLSSDRRAGVLAGIGGDTLSFTSNPPATHELALGEVVSYQGPSDAGSDIGARDVLPCAARDGTRKA